MVPASPIRFGPEIVRKGTSWSDRTLGNRGHTIVPRRQLLWKSMPVNRSSFLGISDIVGDLDLNGIAPVRLDQWPWKLIVYEHDTFVEAVRRIESAGDSEVIGAYHAGIRGSGSSSSGRTPRISIW